MDTVRMVHPNLPGRVAEVPASSVPQHRRAGWEVAPEPPPAPPAETTEAASKPRRRSAASETKNTETTPETGPERSDH